MVRKFLSAFMAIVLLFQAPIFASNSAYADEGSNVTFPFFTSIQLIDVDTDEVLGSPDVTDVDKDAHVKIVYDFALPNDATVNNGDTYTFTIPDQIKLDGGITGWPLQDADGVIFAHVDVSADGTGVVTFTEAASTLRDVGGTFEIQAQFDPTDIDNTEIVKIPFELGTETHYIDVYFQQPDAAHAKSGVYDAATGTVTWTIVLNTNETTIEDGTLVDAISPGAYSSGGDMSQTYVEGTFKVVGSDNTTIFDSSQAPGSQGTGTFTYVPAVGDPDKTGTLTYVFDDAFEDTVTVTYQTVVADPSEYFGQTIPNEAILSHGGIEQTVSGVAQVPVPNYITKTGTYNTETEKIDWTVVFNQDALSLHDVRITDTITGGLVFDPSSVKLDGSTVSEGSADMPGTFTYNADTGVFVYYAGDIDASHTLTFSTAISEPYWQQNQNPGGFTNSATMTATDNSYLGNGATSTTPGIGPGNSVIQKTSLGYDFNTHRITWQIIVNADRQTLPDALITDTIPAGQKYLPDTFAITEGAPPNGITQTYAFSGAVPDDPATTATVLTYRFGVISDAYTITFQTEVTNEAVWAGNTSATYTNAVTLEPGGTIPPSSSEGSQRVDPNVIEKSATYDYTTHEITWSIVVNKSQVPLTGVVVTDVLKDNGLDDFALDASSIQVDGTSISASASMPPAEGSYHYDADTKTLTVNLGNLNSETLSERTKTITFKMALDKEGKDYNDYFSENGDKTITNWASVASNENPSATTKGVQIIHNTLVGKEGYYTSGNAYIDWAVQINQNQIALDDLTLTDVFQEGLELDTSSVSLYRQTLQADGSLTPAPTRDSTTGDLVVDGESVTLTAENVVYDATTRTFVFTMPEGVGDGQPCLLTFRTTVEAQYAGTTFSNSILLEGSGYHPEVSSDNQGVRFTAVGGTAWGTTGEVYFSKEDGATGAPLEGAVFGLYDSYGNLIRISEPTDSDGQGMFGHINFNTKYSVREITAPNDYELADTSFYFQLSRGDGEIHLYDAEGNDLGEASGPLAFSDIRKVGTITFTKLGDGDQPLSGAEFTLCDASGVPVEGFAPQTSGEDGTVSFTNVPYGTYLIKETGAPIGYRPITLDVSLHDSNDAIETESGIHTLDLGSQRDLSTGSLTLVKYRAEFEGGSATLMPGITFEVRDGNNAVIGSAQTTDDQGRIVFDDLVPGTYTLHEVTTPDDYQPADDYEFTISASDTPLERQLMHSITNIKKTGTITLTKVDSIDGVTPLAHATFTLYDVSGENVISNAEGPITATSDADGVITLENVPYGDYILKETVAPSNYIMIGSTEVFLHAGTINLGNVENTRSAGTIRFIKTDGEALLAGAEFRLSGNGIEPKIATSGEDGIVEFTDVPYYDTPYTISETNLPADYYRGVEDFQVTINDDSVNGEGVLELADPVVNVPLGSIILTKAGADGTTFLPGATFDLLDAEGRVIQTQETDVNGVITFADLDLNPSGDTTFTIRETTAPANYTLAADQEVTLSHEQGLREAQITVRDALKAGTIQLMKVDQDGVALAGAVFTLYDAETLLPVEVGGVPVTAVSVDNGLVTFNDIAYGRYVIKESSAPADYLLSERTVEVDLTDDNSSILAGVLSIDASVVNTIKTADIKLTKIGEGSAPLKGATFTLFDSKGENKVLINGSPVTATSDENGLVYFSDIPYGDYKLVETQPPSGYAAVDPLSISLHDSNADLVAGVLDLGKVRDALLPVSGLSKTGDPLMSVLMGLGLVAVAGGLVASAASLRRARRRR